MEIAEAKAGGEVKNYPCVQAHNKRVTLPKSGARATVSQDATQDLLDALDKMCLTAYEMDSKN